MNERIQQLAEQARYDSRNVKHYLERAHNREISFDEYQEIYNKKFAELIVQDCVEQLQKQKNRVQANAEYKRGHTDASDDAAEIIKAHFGVEE